MKKITILAFFLICCTISSQELMTIAGTLVDTDINEPIPYVNIGFVDQGIGTVSNENGSFHLTFRLDDLRSKDVLQISSIGYETLSYNLNELDEMTSFGYVIGMTPSKTLLDEVLITSAKREFEPLGSKTYTDDHYGYWRNAQGLGGELATHIRVKNENTLLHDLRYKIEESYTDSLLVRLNIYDYHRNKPGKNLLNHSIYHTIKKRSGVDTIPLKDHNIVVNDDIIVSLELVEVYGDSIYIVIAGTPYGSTSYRRERSQGTWRPFYDKGLAYSLMSSSPGKSLTTQIRKRGLPQKLTIYWDASLGMINRDFREEMELLDKYLRKIGTKHKTIELEVIAFSQNRFDRHVFESKRGNINDLKKYLEDLTYSGAADFSQLFSDTGFDSEKSLLFTRGVSLAGFPEATGETTISVINSMTDADHQLLDETAFLNGGSYINLVNRSAKDALDFLIYFKDGRQNYNTEDTSVKNSDKGSVYGVVYDDQGRRVSGAVVRVRNSLKEVRSTSNGSYQIDAEDGDVLEISAFGMKTKDTVVQEFKKIHIPMYSDREELQEAVVIGEVEREEELVMTSFGLKKKDAVGVSTSKGVKREDIKDTQTDVQQLLNWGEGIEAVKMDELGTVKYQFRKFKWASIALTTYAAVVVDGVVYDLNVEGARPPELRPDQIEKITFLETAAGTVKYGQVAAYGAIVIETRDSKFQNQEDEETNNLLAKGNDFSEELALLETVLSRQKKSDYMLDLIKADSFEAARATFNQQMESAPKTVSYYIEVSRYFQKWDEKFSLSALSNISELGPSNIKALRALCYEYESRGRHDLATPVLEQIVSIAPNQIQSHLDIARNYKRIGKYEEAASLYKRMWTNSIGDLDFSKVYITVENELRQLIQLHKSLITYADLPNSLLATGFKKDVRIVFEWSDPYADFEIQFVNPDNKFFVYDHSMFNSRERIEDEVKSGYFITEFEIDDAERGEWLINLKQIGNADPVNPTYLKYTVYRNYGTSNETVEIRNIRLSDLPEKATLDALAYTGDSPD